MKGDLFDPAVQKRMGITAVWEHTCFCAIEPSQRSAYARALAALLRPGQRLLGLFF